MTGLFESNHIFHTGQFSCNWCGHQTIIFIRDDYNLFGTMEDNKYCNNCNQVKYTVCDGDLIMRYDWPDADTAPWQMQGAFMLDEDRYCDDCAKVVPQDWRKMVVACSRCD